MTRHHDAGIADRGAACARAYLVGWAQRFEQAIQNHCAAHGSRSVQQWADAASSAIQLKVVLGAALQHTIANRGQTWYRSRRRPATRGLSRLLWDLLAIMRNGWQPVCW